ncbi:MAG: CYTH domain-containing protein [Psychroflexus sp.]|jgi:adenylate cyclase|nr:CYTH domain-containing protein [Psychroflexus sp.]MDR9449062.1 CYTH domain-containing protein [Psychroflexus sp.]
MVEIERKFLVTNTDFKQEATEAYDIKQAYLQKDPAKSVRIRLKNNKAWITIKGISDQQGLIRKEWEYPIPANDAGELLQLCDQKIEKTRYEVLFKQHRYEVDVFKGDNKGLIIAEIELDSKTQEISKPTWLGREITGKTKYYNLALLDHPYKNW